MMTIPFLIVVLNSADALLTYYALHHGAYEANPLMATLIAFSMPSFLFCKLIVANGVVLWLGTWSERKLARLALSAILAIYSALLVYHVFFLYAG
jgi:hypothetical protein